MKRNSLIACMVTIMILLVSLGSVCADLASDSILSSDESHIVGAIAASDGDYDGSDDLDDDFESDGADGSDLGDRDGSDDLDDSDGSDLGDRDGSDGSESDGADDDSDLDDGDDSDDDSDLDDDEDYDGEDEYDDTYDLDGEGPDFYATSAADFYMAKGANFNGGSQSSDLAAGSDLNDGQNVDLSIKTGNPLVPLLISLFSLVFIPFRKI